MASGLLVDYLGHGNIASRPVSPTLFAGSIGLWWSDDTSAFSLWDGSTWHNIGGGGGSGDVVGPGSSVDNSLPRFDGTTGKLLQESGFLLSDLDEVSGYRGNINFQTGTTYTVVTSDTGKVIDHSNAGAITTTLPNNMPVGWCCTYVQAGAGQVTFSAASGATLRNRQSHTKIAGQWGMVVLEVRANSGGSSSEYVLGGDTAA